MNKIMLLILLIFTTNSLSESSARLVENFDIEFTYEEEIDETHILNLIRIEYDTFNHNLNIPDDRISLHDNKINIKFIKKIEKFALEGKSLPSIVIAQAILETGFGRSKKLEYNIFGIKGRGIKSKTNEFYNNKFVKIKSEFQKFSNFKEAFNRHRDIISVYGYNNRDYRHWAHRIKHCGYATDPRYAYKLIYLINKYELYRLDRIQNYNRKLKDINI